MIDWEKTRVDTLSEGFERSDKPWIILTDEWQTVELNMALGFKDITCNSKFGQTQKKLMRTTDGSPISFTRYQFRELVKAMPSPVPDAWKVELKIGIGENKKPILKARAKAEADLC